MPDKKYLNSKQASKYLEISIFTLYRYIKSGKLKAHKLGGSNSKRHYRFIIEELDEFVQGNGSKADA